MVLLPEEAGMTLAELRQMAARQQHQIEAQQQLLVAKEQRLKFLKQQEARHHNLSEQQLDPTCLESLREKVETQELKLRQLRALRGQVEQQKTNNGNLGTELDSIRALFSEKEKELNLAVSKVEELTRQLDEIRNNHNKNNSNMQASAELENLRRELIYRSKLNDQQSNYICQQQENISLRQQDISLLDKKISELTKRLQRKRLLNEQLANQMHNSTLTHNSSHIIDNNGLYYAMTDVDIEPLQREQEPEHTQDDMAAKLHGSHKGFLEEFSLTKNDPKYQTLPYNTKFTLKGKNSEDSSVSSSAEEESWSSVSNSSSNHQNIPPVSVVKPSVSLGNFTPRPFSNASSAPNNSVSKTLQQPLQNKTNDDSFTKTKDNLSQGIIDDDDKPDMQNDHPNLKASTYNKDNSSPTKENIINSQKTNKARIQVETTRSNKLTKPIVPPKPTLPVRSVPPLRHIPVPKEKTVESNEMLSNALSVLQSKSSDKDKNALRYPRRDHGSEMPKTASRIATYFPKSSNMPSDFHAQKNVKPSETTDASESPKRKSSFGQLPIRPKPLTIRKTPGLEPPKLKNQQVPSVGLHRKTSDSNIFATHLKTSINSPFLMQPVEPEDTEAQKPQETNEEAVPTVSIAFNNQEQDEVFKVVENVEIINQEAPVGSVEVESTDENKLDKEEVEKSDESSDSSEVDVCPPKLDSPEETVDSSKEVPAFSSAALRRVKGNLKSEGSVRSPRRVSFDPLALLLDAALEGELELVKKTANEVPNPSAANDEGITALHNAICAGHVEVVTFLVEFGCDVNAQDSDGWTPLHCAASCNNLPMVKFLVERGACVFATTFSDHETAAEKCEEEEEGFDGCSEYLYSLQENLGVMNNGEVFAVYDYEVQNADELSFKDGDKLVVLRKGDDDENEWWWSRLFDEEGYVPRNLLGLYPRVTSQRE